MGSTPPANPTAVNPPLPMTIYFVSLFSFVKTLTIIIHRKIILNLFIVYLILTAKLKTVFLVLVLPNLNRSG